MKITKYQTAILLGIGVVLLVALLDVKSALSGVFGSLCEYTQGNYTEGWWDLFKGIVIVSFLIIPITYYFLVKKDKSEAIAIFISSYGMWMFGLADLFYFWLQGKIVPAALPWLINHPIMSNIANAMNLTIITPLVLYTSIALGFGVVYLSTKFLEKIN